MKLPFLNRTEELKRLQRAFTAQSSSLVCLYGRRRCGKSRLLQKALDGIIHVYYVGDDREAALQRRAVAKEIGRLIPGFERVEYYTWDDLLERWYSDAPSGAVLALDEFPFMAAASTELPGVLQKYVDKDMEKPVHIVLCGSSQRMMYGLVLDSSAPLYGRAREIMKIQPLRIHYLYEVMEKTEIENVVEAYSVWGGVPRYWELAIDYPSTLEAVREIVLNPLSVLFREPERLLSDQMRDTRQAASVLSVIGTGCNRLSEIAARLEKPATSLTRPLSILVDLGLVIREVPFGTLPKNSKRTLYKIADPFLRFWLTFVEPNRSLLEAGLIDTVADIVMQSWPQYIGSVWEELSRQSVPHLSINGRRWCPASRWWGKAIGTGNLEINIVACALDNDSEVLVGEAKRSVSQKEIPRLMDDLKRKASCCPALQGKKIHFALWIMKSSVEGINIITPGDVVASFK